MESQPWVSFCISTFKRPEILRKQLLLLLQQNFDAFEVIISDNDPEASAQNVITAINDPRLKYYHNTENLGMIRSFNKSIDRAGADFIVMVTDDDPVDPGFLSYFHKLWCEKPGYSVYGGFLRKAPAAGSSKAGAERIFYIRNSGTLLKQKTCCGQVAFKEKRCFKNW